MNNERGLFIGVIVGLMMFFVGWAVGESRGESLIEQDAVRTGVAYYTNDVSGKSLFKWKECK